MKLVVTNKKLSESIIHNIACRIKNNYCLYDVDGLSTNEIKEMLDHIKDEDFENAVIITADTRLLKFVNKYFLIRDVYVFELNNGDMNMELKLIQDTTIRILRVGHNLMNLYESGEFKIK